MSDEIKMKAQLEYYDKAEDVSGDILREYRKLWDEAFHDPEAFTDYYFRCVCKKNRLLGAYMDGRLVGMLHMNPYRVRLGDKTADCYYIVGVAVQESMRRQGLMRLMMERAIWDMRSEECPITFLMPRRQEYYTGFGFKMVYETRILQADVNRLVKDFKNRQYKCAYKVSDIREYTSEQLVVLSQEINALLEERYSFYACRTDSYLRAMLAEHRCQNGAVCVVREQKELRCVFSYDIYDETMYVERFEPLAGNVLHMLWEIFCFAEKRDCALSEITVPACESLRIESGWQAYIQAGMIKLAEGCGIMALSLAENDAEAPDGDEFSFEHGMRNILDKMKNVSFFDEIV